MALKNVVALAGGVGGAKLAHGLAQILNPPQVTVIVNTADDFWHYGLRICPDLDTVTYTLAGIVNKVQGWGISGDTTNALAALQRYGQEPWFKIGDQDLATHLARTQWLREGVSLTEITRRIAVHLDVRQRLLPMTNAPVATMVNTVEHGEVDFQTYFVRLRWQPAVKTLRLAGIQSAALTKDVSEVLEAADVVLIAPSNPWLSIAPILAVPGLCDALLARRVPRVAITPIVGGQAVKGPAAKLMAELGYEPSAAAVANYYGDLINGFVQDIRDPSMEIPGQYVTALDTIMLSDADRATLARNVLDWIEGW